MSLSVYKGTTEAAAETIKEREINDNFKWTWILHICFCWDCEKIGHETEEWDEERVRNDENKRTNKERKERARLYKKYFGTWKE